MPEGRGTRFESREKNDVGGGRRNRARLIIRRVGKEGERGNSGGVRERKRRISGSGRDMR